MSKNLNIGTDSQIPSDVIIAKSLENALETLSSPIYDNLIEKIFVIGGGSIYEEALKSNLCESIKLTSIESEIPECDVFLSPISAMNFQMVSRSSIKIEAGINYRFIEFKKISPDFDNTQSTEIKHVNQEEIQYLQIIDEILKNGVFKGDRTGFN